MPYREEDRFQGYPVHGRLDPETVAHITLEEIRRLRDQQASFHTRQEDFDDRLSRVERIREIVWEAVKFLFKDGLKIAAAIIGAVLLLTGHITVDQIIKLSEAFKERPHLEESHSPAG